MEGKDNRSKDKRHKMKAHFRSKSKYCTNSSSSGPNDTVRSVVDVVDSSDERFIEVHEWSKGGRRCPAQKQRDYPLEMDSENPENEQMRAGDFKLMSQLPTSIGGHFQFSTEKQWEIAENDQLLNKTEASEYFKFNLQLLNVGLQTIPFYKRMDYAASMFSAEQLLNMEKASEASEKIYQQVLKEHIENPKLKINSGSQKSRDSARSQKPEKPLTDNETNDELEDLLNISTDPAAKIDLPKSQETSANVEPDRHLPGVKGAENKNEIQEWLDNVLEE
ncbi:uncharacterized protein LOC119634407 [Glossina fuscipes]|uniref:Uncharacterized protein LOC119634407 n=1 Tax=Glossina fuscipes TaxID=7396 RepID=A0A8U0WI50_9MUSC|nr:uncharacterized protein LOC119634407 [Glossina fuscipes]